MNEAVPHAPSAAPAAGHPLWVKLAAGLATLLLLLVLLVVFFPWDVLRGPLNRYVSERTGRHFEITRKLDVKLGRTTRILADGIEFANPEWAQDKHLVKAESAEIDVRLLPLLHRRIELPVVTLHKPVLGLQMEPDGRRTWALGRDTGDKTNLPQIGALVVDEGAMHFVAREHGADIHTDFAIDGNAADQLPLTFKARGTWQKEGFSAQGRTGNVLHLAETMKQPFPLRVNLSAANTVLHAEGSMSSLATLDGADASFSLQGHNLAELYKLLGVVLPETPRYALKGHITKQGEVWNVTQINGKLGNSDLTGQLAFDQTQSVPLLSGKVQSKALDFDDLAPLVGLPEQPRSASALPQVPVAAPAQKVRTARAARDPARKVLPTAALDLERLKAMNADVHYSAARITNVRQLPLDRMSLHVKLNQGVLLLDEMNLGVAGGSVLGKLRFNGNSNPAVAEARLDAKSLELGKLFPGAKITQASFGKIHGLIDLKGRGNSVAQMLATSSGNVAALMGKGQISNLLLEIAGLDGGEIIKFLIRGDQNVEVRCAAAGFSVDKGLMSTRTLVFDTADTVMYGEGTVSLAQEAMDLTLHPYPKDKSILALRSPLKVGGTFSAPRAGVDKGALAGRAGVALALGVINPLLALAATIETGPGKDADCHAVLEEAAAPAAAARAAAAGTPAPSKPAQAPEAQGPAARGEKLARKSQPWTAEQIYKQ
ncbi:MAG: AsmA family protein [Burkholderiales bacterium]|nr:AsmA family protein [Burkholderiales bacterium]